MDLKTGGSAFCNPVRFVSWNFQVELLPCSWQKANWVASQQIRFLEISLSVYQFTASFISSEMFNILTDHLSFHSFAFISQEPKKASRQQPKKFIIPYSVHKYFFLQKSPNSWHDREAFGRNNKICILMRCTFAVPNNSKADDLYLSVLY